MDSRIVLALLLSACTGAESSPPVYDEPSTDGDGDDRADDASDHGDADREAPEPACGDGRVDIGEQCDDGNVRGGDGCSTVCLAEDADPDAVGPVVCGDGLCSEGEGPAGCSMDCECEAGSVEVLCNGVVAECYFRDHPRFDGDCADCVADGSGRFPGCQGAGDCWHHCDAGQWVVEAWCQDQCEDRSVEVPEACGCPDAENANNFCHLPPRTAGCPMTAPGGYCDPDGDGSYEDGDWDRGWSDFDTTCRGQRRVVPEDPEEDECQACGGDMLHVASDETPCDCPETWRVVFDESFDTEVSQVCRRGVWLNFNLDPRDPDACCGGDFQGCCQRRDTDISCY